MTPKPLALVGRKHPALHQAADLVADIDGTVVDIVARMKATLAAVGHGAALAAPQVGRPLSVVVTAPSKVEARCSPVLINPTIAARGGSTVSDLEGCLSLPGRWYEVERHHQVTVTGLDLDGETVVREYVGFEARLWQHELDHLAGVLICESWPEIRRP